MLPRDTLTWDPSSELPQRQVITYNLGIIPEEICRVLLCLSEEQESSGTYPLTILSIPLQVRSLLLKSDWYGRAFRIDEIGIHRTTAPACRTRVYITLGEVFLAQGDDI